MTEAASAGTHDDDIGDDAVLVARSARGDAEAFRVLVVRHQASLLAVVRDLLPGEADREDVAQDAFVSAWLHLADYDAARGAFFVWLVQIARNRARNVRRKRRPVTVSDVPERAVTSRPEEAMSREEAHRRLDDALAALPDDQRTAFVLAEIHGIPYADVAAIEGVPLGTVKSRAARAREKLRAALSREEIEP
ncbi:MAG: sigma-70 family RNA polymerase sigma factor [Planctomycetes bacterium]|nr:sigma-70 family RNA polymerase sigma factor [Planctomycetota bacterium]